MISQLQHRLVVRIILWVGVVMLIFLALWGITTERLLLQMGTVSSNIEGAVWAYADGYMVRYAIWAAVVLAVTLAGIWVILRQSFIHPVQALIEATQDIVYGEYSAINNITPHNEIGRLANAVKQMGLEISQKQQEINKQKNEYQKLFELVPCIISVQDRDYKLISYNQEFSKRFAPEPGDYCYSAYKGSAEKCKFCPVEKTFEDGKPHYSEETGMNKDGSMTNWIVKTAPVKNPRGDIIAAMEMSLDITQIKQLENRLASSEQKYYAIFNNIPNPIFVLDGNTLEIINCNKSVTNDYGYLVEEVLHTSFLDFFADREKLGQLHIENQLKISTEMNNVRHLTKNGDVRYVNIRIAPSEEAGGSVFFVTTSDVTRNLETELQLAQAGKMATLGEMATGVAHELNQPLSVIKTASSFFMKKVKQKKTIPPDILLTLSQEIDSHVDRASNIINHLRQFGRKSAITLTHVDVNTVLKNAFDMFHQQLKLREIEVIWDLRPDLPEIMAESSRLEQVFINLLINARDAIEEKMTSVAEQNSSIHEAKQITLKTYAREKSVFIEVVDTGMGIPEHLIEKVFQPFFTTKKVGKGTGLGLSISYGIIKSFQGEVKASANEGMGTRFIIQFPEKEMI